MCVLCVLCRYIPNTLSTPSSWLRRVACNTVLTASILLCVCYVCVVCVCCVCVVCVVCALCVCVCGVCVVCVYGGCVCVIKEREERRGKRGCNT